MALSIASNSNNKEMHDIHTIFIMWMAMASVWCGRHVGREIRSESGRIE